MSLEIDYICSVCAKIIKNPTGLPCTVCGETLKDTEANNTDTIKCATCDIEYNIKEHTFFPKKLIDKMLSQYIDEEKSFKLQIDKSMEDLYCFCERSKLSLEVECQIANFREIKRQIEARQNESKLRIEDIHMDIIEMNKKTVDQYMDSALETLEEDLYDHQLLNEVVNSINRKQEEKIPTDDTDSNFDETIIS